MILISAMSRDRVIGRGDGMPWNVPEEYAQFLRFIDGQTVIMGRRSWEIFGDDLTSAHTIVVTRRRTTLAGVEVVDSVAAAVDAAARSRRRVFVAGGAQIYDQTMPLADAMYLSFIKGDFDGDAFFPEFDESEWLVERREDHPRFEFVVYRRRPTKAAPRP